MGDGLMKRVVGPFAGGYVRGRTGFLDPEITDEAEGYVGYVGPFPATK